MTKQSTKICPKCGCDQLSKLHGEDKKLCTGCGHEIDWPLDEGQKSLFKPNVVGTSDGAIYDIAPKSVESQAAYQGAAERCMEAKLSAENASLREQLAGLRGRFGDLDNRHSNHCFHTNQFKERIQKLMGVDEDNWFGLIDILEAKWRQMKFAEQAVQSIHALMNGTEWDSSTCSAIADALHIAGYQVDQP